MAKIMVVDDEPEVSIVVSTMLEKEGHEIIKVYSGMECLERLKEEKPDLILLDIMMPGLDGWEVCRRIKNTPDTKDIPVAMLTIRSSESDQSKSFKYSKADGHINKKKKKKKLTGTINWILKNRPKN